MNSNSIEFRIEYRVPHICGSGQWTFFNIFFKLCKEMNIPSLILVLIPTSTHPIAKYVFGKTMFTVRKFNEYDSIAPLTYCCIIIDKMLIYWQQILHALSQYYKNNFFQQWGRGGRIIVSFQQQVLLYSKHFFGVWILVMCSLLNDKSFSLFKHCCTV
jgi:hypothetical protein